MKSAIVFGGSGGIGSEIAKTLKSLGYGVVSCDIHELEGFHSDYFIEADLTSEAEVKRAISFVHDKFGSIDVAINAQGAYELNLLENTSKQRFDEIINVNLKSVFLVCKNLAPLMKWQKRGYIVNIASMAGLRGKAGESAYCASKYAVVGLTEAIHEEIKGTGARITAVCPASVHTRFLTDEVEIDEREAQQVLRPIDIARVIGELVSSDKRVVRTIIPIDTELNIDKISKKKN